MGDARQGGSRPLEVPLPPHLAGPEPEDPRPTRELGYCLVTGGAGFLGRHLVRELLRRGHRVRAFDCRSQELRHERLDVARGDVRALEDLRKACVGIETVFHTAAVLDFARFASRVRREHSVAVNVRGVDNALRAAREAGARRFVHTSTNNVTLDGPVIDGDESRPYAMRVRDIYTETKIAGERLALAANGEGGLLTCAIRPGGIYGPGEQIVFPRVVSECRAGRYAARIGGGSALSDNTYVDNLVDGEIEAARHLVPGSPLCGQAYFVTDGRPINYFDFFRPVVEGLGFRHPRPWVPGGLVHAVMTAWEWLHFAFGLPRPPLLSLEVRKIVVSHYNRIDRARRDFGWTPKVSMEEGLRRCLEHLRQPSGPG
jgi:3beta-hydroxy-delta5-steroid dehydrogenase/steroid delta-isomerase